LGLKVKKKNNFRSRKYNVKKGDTVYVVAGKEKGKTGKVIKVFILYCSSRNSVDDSQRNKE